MSKKVSRKEIYLVLDNIRSALNVGSIFRTADGAGVSKTYLCGYTPTPENPRVAKTALRAEKTVLWEKHSQTWRLLDTLKKRGVKVVALEQSERSIDYRKFKPKFPVVLVVGNEVKGLSKKILKYSDVIISIPMFGKKESLNVAVAAGIATYEILKFRHSDI